MLSVCRTIHLLRKRGPQTSTDNTIGKSSLNVMWNADMRSGQVPYVQCVRKIAPKPMVPDASVYRSNVGVVNHGWASIKLRPLNCSMKIDHACKSRRLSLLRVILWLGFVTFLVKSVRRRKKQRQWRTTWQQKFNSPSRDRSSLRVTFLERDKCNSLPRTLDNLSAGSRASIATESSSKPMKVMTMRADAVFSCFIGTPIWSQKLKEAVEVRLARVSFGWTKE